MSWSNQAVDELIIGNPQGSHVFIGQDGAGHEGAFLFGPDGVTVLASFDIANLRGTLTGGLVQTSPVGSGQGRIQLDSTGLYVQNAAGNEILNIQTARPVLNIDTGDGGQPGQISSPSNGLLQIQAGISSPIAATSPQIHLYDETFEQIDIQANAIRLIPDTAAQTAVQINGALTLGAGQSTSKILRGSSNFSMAAANAATVTVTFATPFSATPNVQLTPQIGSSDDVAVNLQGVTSTGFTARVFQTREVTFTGSGVLWWRAEL